MPVMARELVVAEVVVDLETLSIVPPSTFFAVNAAGTAPRIFLGAISPSHDGAPPEPPTSTPR